MNKHNFEIKEKIMRLMKAFALLSMFFLSLHTYADDLGVSYDTEPTTTNTEETSDVADEEVVVEEDSSGPESTSSDTKSVDF